MSEGDTSSGQGVAFEGEGDACDTYDPSTTAPGSAGPCEHENAANQGVSVSTPRTAERRARRGAKGERALLDSSLLAPSSSTGEEQTPDAGALDRSLRWIVLACLAPALEAARPTGLQLASLSLTAPDEDSIAQAAEHFAHAIVDHPLAGALLTRDLGEEHGRAHYHAIALALSLDAIRDHWAEFVGTGGDEPKVEPVNRWRDFCREPYERLFAPNLLRVVQYTFKPWPAGLGRRSLDRDVLASGAFVRPWRAVRAALAGGLPVTLEGAVEASPTCRLCLWCKRPLPAGARSDKQRHDRCRKRSSKAKRRAERATEGRNGSESTPDGAP